MKLSVQHIVARHRELCELKYVPSQVFQLFQVTGLFYWTIVLSIAVGLSVCVHNVDVLSSYHLVYLI